MVDEKRNFLGRMFGFAHDDQPMQPGGKTAVPTQTEIDAFRDAILPKGDQGGSGYELIPLDGTPEEVADALISSSLPRVFFNQIDLSTQIGMGQLLAMF